MKFVVIIFIINNLFSQTVLYFNGSNAMNYLEEQCELGPRYPGSIGHLNAINFYKNHFDKYSDDVSLLEGYTIHPHSLDSIKLTNIFSRFNINSDYRILLMAHFDTRQYADQDKNIDNQKKSIIGANDGASGVAVLMELAKFIHDNPLINIGVDILLTDGEDMGKVGDTESWGLGAKLFSSQLPPPVPVSAICVDMIGDKELNLPIELNSYLQAPELVLDIWKLALELGFNQFEMRIGNAIIDDHYVLYKETNIPSINIIDFNYPNSELNFWHTIEDTPDKCSAKSLEAVGTVLINYLYRLELGYNDK